jgi:hypothetical protein
MNRRYLKLHGLPALALAGLLWCFQGAAGTGAAQGRNQAVAEKSFVVWQSPARLHGLIGKERGDFKIGVDGIGFRVENHGSEKWAFEDIQTFRLSPHRLTIETYQNRKRHVPGVARYRFDLEVAVPPSIAVELANNVQRPSQNAIPDPASQDVECGAIPAHHNMVTGGTNGILRFRVGGIDYVSSATTDSRRWRWADLQTLSDPDPYHLLVFGYRDTYSFELKETLSPSLFYRLVDALDAHNAGSGQNSRVQFPVMTEGHRCGVGDE